MGPGGELASCPLASFVILMRGMAPKTLLTSVADSGEPPVGVPVAVARFVYWPATAGRDAAKVQVSPGSSKPLVLVSPALKVVPGWRSGVGRKSSAGLVGVPLSSLTVTAESGR